MKRQTFRLSGGLVTAFSILFMIAMTLAPLAPVNADSLSDLMREEIGGQGSSGSDAPSSIETSAFLIGKVAVGVVAIESSAASANTETWTAGELDTVNLEIRSGLKRWADWGGAAAGLEFYVDVNGDGNSDDDTITASAPLDSLDTDISPVTIDLEPIANASTTYDVWTGTVLTAMNGSYTGSTEEKWYQYANALRQGNNADWAFIIFVVDSSTDRTNDSITPGRFTNGKYLVAPTFGPAMVMTSTNGTLGIDYMEWVTAQLTARAFGAGSQAEIDCGSQTTQKFGYLAIANSYCAIASPAGVTGRRLMYHGDGDPDVTTKQQVGWRDSDGDGKYDPVDTSVTLLFTSYTPDPTTQTSLTYEEPTPNPENKRYRAYDNPLAAASCSLTTDECYFRHYYNDIFDPSPAVTINTIQTVKFRLDGGTWSEIPGTYDSDFEIYSFVTGTLDPGKRKIEVQAFNSAGVSSPALSDVVTIIGAQVNDFFADRIAIPALSYDHAIDTTTATESPDDPIPPSDDTWECGTGQMGMHSVWYEFVPATIDEVFLDTFGSSYDTIISVWDDIDSSGGFVVDNGGSWETQLGELVSCNDDAVPGENDSRLSFTPTLGTTYYIMISEYNNSGAVATSDKPDVGGQTGGTLFFHALSSADVDVYIGSGADPIKNYILKPSASVRENYLGVNNGPVRVISTTDTPIIVTERHAWKVNGVYTSYAEMMGLPSNQLSDTYIFPWYNNATMNTELRVGNVGNASTTVAVKIAGQVVDTFSLTPNASARKSYAGVNNGPMEVSSSGGVEIIATHRFAWMSDGIYTSITEMMGLPLGQLTDTYVFPWYNNQTMDTQLRVGNVGTADTTITVKIGGVVVDTFPLAQNAGARKSYNLNAGPVEVKSSNGVLIIATERHAWKVNGVYKSYAEMMGLPGAVLTDYYVFPWYNNATMNTELRIGNVGNSATTITVKIGGDVVETFALAQNASARKSYVGVNNGPMEVSSSGGVKIITTHRFAWLSNGIYSSITEMLGLPYDQLTTAYVFPWYNNQTMDTQMRIGVP